MKSQNSATPVPRAWLRMYQAELHLAAGEHTQCQARATEATALADRRGLQPIAKLARIITARCAEKGGDLTVASRYAEEAADLIEDQLGRVTGTLARQELGFQAFQLYRLLVALEVRSQKNGYMTRAFSLAERARARAHLDAVVHSEVARFSATLPVSPALAPIGHDSREEAREEAKERVRRLTKALLSSRADRDVAARHRDALWALEEINEEIAGRDPLLLQVAAPLPATVARVRKRLLDSDSVLLSYFFTPDAVLVFAVTDASQSLAVLSGSVREIDTAIRRYRDDFLLDPDSDLSDLRHSGAALYQTLIGPVARHLEGKRRLIVVPHGSLASLPFESLVTPKGQFLVQSKDVSYSVSATLAVALAKRRPRRKKRKGVFVGLGDPVYDWAAFQRGERETAKLANVRGLAMWQSAARSGGKRNAPLGLERIPGTASELNRIAKLFGPKQARIYLRGQASEELVKAGALSGHRIIHIASHGLMAPHYQALALTLAPQSDEDGFLMSSEIASLDLDADLVVLSACRTGNTRSRSAEPVAGMALSLRSAGARSVLVSLWNVDDDATAELMVKFYRPLVASKITYARSLSRAKRVMIAGEDNGHPYFWAPFVLHGP